jgi:2-C-methyl-D-erythritol 4-phosphate cytidylyltransferase
VSVWSIVVAAGDGRRFGAAPKQFELLRGRRVLDWAIDAARDTTDGVVVVVADDRVADEAATAAPTVVVVAGGATRSASVRAGLAAVPDDADVVVVHDAARPMASAATFRMVIAAVRDGADGAIPGVAVVDTIKRVADGTVAATLDRTELVAVQTPQAFAAGALRRAHADEPEATDDAALIEAAGGKVVVVPGEARNMKITTADDLATLARHLDD